MNKIDYKFEQIKNDLSKFNEKLKNRMKFLKTWWRKGKKFKEELKEIITRNFQYLRDPDKSQIKQE